MSVLPEVASPVLWALIVPEWVANWLTPVFLLGVGALAGLLGLLMLWGLFFVLAAVPGIPEGLKRMVREVPLAVREGVLFPLFWIVVAMSCFGVFGAVFAHNPQGLLASVLRLRSAGTQTMEFDIPSTPRDAEGDIDFSKETAVPVGLLSDEIREMEFDSSQDLTVSTTPYVAGKERTEYRVAGGEPYQWRRQEQGAASLPEGTLSSLYIANHGSEPAHLKLQVTTAPAFPEVRTIPWTAVSVMAVFLFYIFLRAVAPRLSAIALATYKSEVAQPLFSILLAIGIFAVMVFEILPYNTFGEDIKMLKDTGFYSFMLLCLIQAIWASSTSVAEEIEGRTALTVLSKPIRRPSFVLGKFLGIAWTVALMFIIFGVVFLVLVAYKPLYDGRENSNPDVNWQLCHYEMIVTVPGLVLAFMQTLVLAAISVAISTRMSLLANFALCFSIYVLGNITPVLVQSSANQFEIVAFFAQLIATVLPNLETFNIQAAISADVEVPLVYLGMALVYCILYSSIALLLALALFEDRDLA